MHKGFGSPSTAVFDCFPLSPPPPPLSARSSQARELNPYFKDGGRGLPPEEQQSDQQRAESMKTKVGDGGLSWRMKALKRAKEQASDQGLHLDEVRCHGGAQAVMRPLPPPSSPFCSAMPPFA